MVQDPPDTVFYLPHGPRFYGQAFPAPPQEIVTEFFHQMGRGKEMAVLSPVDLSLQALDPGNFLKMGERWGVRRLWLVDRIRGRSPLVHIVDHRNFSGVNPLRGRTPLKNRPRFPDVSRLYSREEIGLPRKVVTTVGTARFGTANIPNGSELAALVALCAGYVGMDVVAIGWDDDMDPDGDQLGDLVRRIVTGGISP